ncbi:cellulose biosynthesis protein CelD [Methylobacterium nodulans ORS 2060]|uniref:Cellulose biosynthesis protein CelD n=1 Tax=Methylobacterium nodulans (strain LMG 21967 / CNCM I-2342 / ORS 2060) TaxID=460265 RepID=B8IEP3_METNO|nr:cellulose biosynthesis protein CelD [Methylobacterium nodulans ORS 2060]
MPILVDADRGGPVSRQHFRREGEAKAGVRIEDCHRSPVTASLNFNAGSCIEVEQADPARFWAVRSSFRDLAARAVRSHAFAEPAIVAAAAEGGQQVIVLLAWGKFSDVAPSALVGAWPLVVRRRGLFSPVRTLASPLNPMCYVGSPVLDESCSVDVLRKFIVFIRNSKLPPVLSLGDLYADDDHMKILEDAFATERVSYEVLGRRRRAKLQSELGGDAYLAETLSSQTRKKLNQKWRRLKEIDDVQEDCSRGRREDILSTLDEILSVEQAGWKGRRSDRGRAVLLDSGKAGFVRSAIRGMAEDDLVACRSIRLGGQLVAGQILLYSGLAAFTWLTAYDEKLSKYSPGILLLKFTTLALLNDPGVCFADSCNPDHSGYMADMWRDHMDVIDIVVDVRPGWSISLRLLSAAQRARRHARSLLRTGYHMLRRSVAGLRSS